MSLSQTVRGVWKQADNCMPASRRMPCGRWRWRIGVDGREGDGEGGVELVAGWEMTWVLNSVDGVCSVC